LVLPPQPPPPNLARTLLPFRPHPRTPAIDPRLLGSRGFGIDDEVGILKEFGVEGDEADERSAAMRMKKAKEQIVRKARMMVMYSPFRCEC
jgi:hypothetical protein